VKAEEKIPGGKLVCIEVSADMGKTTWVRITGDFFLHPEDRIDSLEGALAGVLLSSGEGEIAAILEKALGDSILIGVTCKDLARIFIKAVKQ